MENLNFLFFVLLFFLFFMVFFISTDKFFMQKSFCSDDAKIIQNKHCTETNFLEILIQHIEKHFNIKIETIQEYLEFVDSVFLKYKNLIKEISTLNKVINEKTLEINNKDSANAYCEKLVDDLRNQNEKYEQDVWLTADQVLNLRAEIAQLIDKNNQIAKELNIANGKINELNTEKNQILVANSQLTKDLNIANGKIKDLNAEKMTVITNAQQTQKMSFYIDYVNEFFIENDLNDYLISTDMKNIDTNNIAFRRDILNKIKNVLFDWSSAIITLTFSDENKIATMTASDFLIKIYLKIQEINKINGKKR